MEVAPRGEESQGSSELREGSGYLGRVVSGHCCVGTARLLLLDPLGEGRGREVPALLSHF